MWFRPKYGEKVKNLKKGDIVYLRTDIHNHKDNIRCGFVPEHLTYQGMKVRVHYIAMDTNDHCRYFKISENSVWFDTDMIDWEKTVQNNNTVNKLINWIN